MRCAACHQTGAWKATGLSSSAAKPPSRCVCDGALGIDSATASLCCGPKHTHTGPSGKTHRYDYAGCTLTGRGCLPVCHVIQLREFLTTERMLGMNAIMNRGSLVCVCVCVCVCVLLHCAPSCGLHTTQTWHHICHMWCVACVAYVAYVVCGLGMAEPSRPPRLLAGKLRQGRVWRHHTVCAQCSAHALDPCHSGSGVQTWCSPMWLHMHTGLHKSGRHQGGIPCHINIIRHGWW
jgi:hypothetical protein